MQSAGVAAERAIRSDNAVTGDEDVDQIRTARCTHSARGARLADFLRHPGVRTCLAAWNGSENQPDFSLKRCACGKIERCRKPHGLA